MLDSAMATQQRMQPRLRYRTNPDFEIVERGDMNKEFQAAITLPDGKEISGNLAESRN